MYLPPHLLSPANATSANVNTSIWFHLTCDSTIRQRLAAGHAESNLKFASLASWTLRIQAAIQFQVPKKLTIRYLCSYSYSLPQNRHTGDCRQLTPENVHL